MNHLHSLPALGADRVAALVARALELSGGSAPRRAPAGKALGLLFLAPSLRTQASMQRAAQRVGVEVVTLGSGLWGLEARPGVVMDGEAAEHAIEAAGVLGQYVDALGVRAFPVRRSFEEDAAELVWRAFVEHAGVPLVNLESPCWHPCQALADRAALEELEVPRTAKLVVTWAPHPRPLPHAVANSSVCMAAQRGMEVVLARPAGFDLAPDVLATATRLADEAGGSFRVSDDPGETRDAAAVVAKSWGTIEHWSDPAGESAVRADLDHWRVTPARLAAGARFLHCLPVRRNVVVDDAVLDSPASAVLVQAKHRLHAQTAVLEQVFRPAPSLATAGSSASPSAPTGR